MLTMTAELDSLTPRISVVIVSDYEPGEKTWGDERSVVGAFLRDELGEPFEVVVTEALGPTGKSSQVPAELAALAPQVRVHFEPGTRSSTLKDAALKHCRGELIAVVEADCLPERGWLKTLVAELDRNDKLDVVSGRTTYGLNTSLRRVASLLDRGHMERVFESPHVQVSNNGAVYRRHVLERFKYPDEANPFVSAELRRNAMRQANVVAGVQTQAVMRHAFGGWSFLADVRRNKGFQAARILLHFDSQAARRSKLTLALRALRRRIAEDWATVRAVGSTFLRWYDWPLLALVFLAVRVPEFFGALSADQPERFAQTTAYR
jgi:Glycosyl transferase family 2